MPLPDDMSLWDQIKDTITPLGEPRAAGEARYLSAQFSPSFVDLHGYTIQDAYERVERAIDRNREGGRYTLTVITGRSGEICQEFPTWCTLNPDVRMVEPLNGGGAFLLKLRK